MVVPPGKGAAALQDVSFSLNAGSALGIIGPTGSGKSSLARAIIGVMKDDTELFKQYSDAQTSSAGWPIRCSG